MIRKIRSSRAVPAVGLAAGVALLLAGCGGGGGSEEPTTAPTNGGDTTEPGGELQDTRDLYVYTGNMPPIVSNFNPWAWNALHPTTGMIYEPLFYYNSLSTDPPKGLLGESFEWSDDFTELTVVIKSDLKWSDGEDLTAEDVAFTYGYGPNDRAYVSSVEAVDDTTVVFQLDGPQVNQEYALLGSTLILPEHIWADIEDPGSTSNDNPIGSGPYKLDAITESQYTVVRNDLYRDRDQLAVPSVVYLAIDGNEPTTNMLLTGELDYAGLFVPDREILLSQPHIGGMNTPKDPTVIETCSNAELGCKGPQTDVAVRQALNLALDRGTINDLAFGGNAGIVSPAMVLLGRDEHYIGEGIPHEMPQEADVAGAKAILEEAGYTLNSDGIYEKDGQAVEMTIISPSGWTDYNDAGRMIETQALEAGIKIVAETPSQAEWDEARQTGNFTLSISGIPGTAVADPFLTYRDRYTTDYTGPVGEPLPPGTNGFTRYSNPIVDAAVAEAAGTGDVDTKAAAYAQVQGEIVRDLPFIPLVLNSTMSWWNTEDFSGWPSEDNLYAFPPPWDGASAAEVIKNLRVAE